MIRILTGVKVRHAPCGAILRQITASKGSKGEPWAGKRLELTLRGFEGFEGPSKRFVHAAVSKDSMDKGYEGWCRSGPK